MSCPVLQEFRKLGMELPGLLFRISSRAGAQNEVDRDFEARPDIRQKNFQDLFETFRDRPV